MFEVFVVVLGIMAIVCLLNIASHLRECHEAIQRHVVTTDAVRKEIGEMSTGLRICLSRLNYQPMTVADQYKSQYEKSLEREQLKALHRDLAGY